MQLYIIDWSFQSAEDQLFATNEFCEYLKEGKIYKNVEGFELTFMAHIPQNGSGLIICKAESLTVLFKIFKMWRDNFNIAFNFKPAITNEELLVTQSEKSIWSQD